MNAAKGSAFSASSIVRNESSPRQWILLRLGRSMHQSVSSQALFNSTRFTNSKQPFFIIISSRQGRSDIKKTWRDHLSWRETCWTWKGNTEESPHCPLYHKRCSLPNQLSSKRASLCIILFTIRVHSNATLFVWLKLFLLITIRWREGRSTNHYEIHQALDRDSWGT